MVESGFSYQFFRKLNLREITSKKNPKLKSTATITTMRRRRCAFSVVLLLMVLSLSCLSHELTELRSPPIPPHHKAFEPAEENSSFFVDVDETAITKALWDSGYKIMSLFIRQKLRQYVPYASRLDLFYELEGITIPPTRLYNNKTITIFVPPDQAIRFENWIRAECQVITSKIDKHSFQSILREGDELPTRAYVHLVVVTGTEPPSINNVTITEWDIYNDGNVHGVEDFFPPSGRMHALYDPRLPYNPQSYWHWY